MKNQSLLFVIAALVLSTSCSDEQLAQVENNIISSNIIIGADNRVRVSGEYDSYNRTVGQIIFEKDNQKISLCSATAIDDQFIITAAHCFYEGTTILKNAYFYPGRRESKTMPFDRFPVQEFFHPKEYNPSTNALTNSGHDIAIARVGVDSQGRGLQRRVGFMGLWGMNQLSLTQMKTIGYPGDKGDYFQYKEENCRAHNDQSLFFSTTCDTFKGQSGSPAFFFHQATEKYYIRGVIASETDQENIVAKLTQRRVEIIQDIIDNNITDPAWVMRRVFKDARVRVIIDNQCSKDMHVAYHQFDEPAKTEGFYTIKAGQRYEMFYTKFANYRLHIRDFDGHVHIGNHGSHRHSVFGRQYIFETFMHGSWGDSVHTLCR